ncbi:hypothetical protein A2Z33_02645 [Candidatus Gottesmanbacteria bacterium RBG_16_52_11]|uniref:HD domain-containing protein n=1 Tax=Candidatus Gottesmanbacteria bacterium RBG_16_52_11 TaxID=1798374 RepID=A0A1F5YMZ0_9BACT|nr:MAG: hypothetical protein A2Z33_02645 [Candidatus Gottesmanbacteria bacterium RBG_16_52_11]
MKFSRDEALALVHEWTKNPNLVKHMLAVETVMRALCLYLYDKGVLSVSDIKGNTRTELAEVWGIAGLVHDADYEQFKDDPKKHPSVIFPKLEERGADPSIINAVRAHGWGNRAGLPEPATPMEWSLYCADELTGLVIACALVRPEKSLATVSVESVLKKWPQKAFAAGVHREQIGLCESKLGIPLPEFISIALTAMQGIHAELGL